jgi:site-specific DNA-methyltransferase (adenine-specific)
MKLPALNLPSFKNVKLEDIEPGERFRKEYGQLEELGLSIKNTGLINPITIGLNPKAALSDKPHPTYLLAAGGRRMAAHKLLSRSNPEFNVIQCMAYDRVLTDLELRSIELEENIKRKDFTYAEAVVLKDEVQKLRTSIYGIKITKDGAEGWTQKDTAKLFGQSEATIAQDLKLAKAFKDFPALGLDKMKNKSEAMKRLNKFGKTITNQVVAERFEKSLKDRDVFKKKMVNSFVLKDFFEGIKQVPKETIDFCEIDPPYAIDLKRVKKGYDKDGYNEMKEDKYEDIIAEVLVECYRVMKPNSWLILWFAPEPWFEVMYNLLTYFKFKTHHMCGIWTKPTGQTNIPYERMGNSYEMFFYASKGSPRLNKPGRSNNFNYRPIPHQSKNHPTERPVDMIQDILDTFAKPGSNVLVPFLGSGNTLIAAYHQKMNAFGFELNEGYKNSYMVNVERLV